MDKDTALDYLSALTDAEFTALAAERSTRRGTPALTDVKALIYRELNRDPSTDH